jgi:purine nucleosidase
MYNNHIMKKLSFVLAGFFMVFTSLTTIGQTTDLFIAGDVSQGDFVKPRYRVIIDNDFSGDPDGLVHLAHQLLSPSTQIRAIIGSAYSPVFPRNPDPCASAVDEVNKLLSIMGLQGKYPVLSGSNSKMTVETPADCEGARAIIAEAMRTDAKLPLYVLCGASLKTVASAYLIEPAIADKLTIIWIGGYKYEGVSKVSETNLHISIPAAQVIFNKSDIPVWQVPRETYSQAIMSMAEMETSVASHGELGRYLTDKITATIAKLSPFMRGGETYVLGDSPLALLTALQAFYERESSSSQYIIKNAPTVTDNGVFIENPNGRQIKVYTSIDNRLMFGDFIAKLTLFNKN